MGRGAVPVAPLNGVTGQSWGLAHYGVRSQVWPWLNCYGRDDTTYILRFVYGWLRRSVIPPESITPTGVPIDTVEIGKCFVTELGQVRRVLSVKDGSVVYETARWRGGFSGSAQAITTVPITHFARTVKRELPLADEPGSEPEPEPGAKLLTVPSRRAR